MASEDEPQEPEDSAALYARRMASYLPPTISNGVGDGLGDGDELAGVIPLTAQELAEAAGNGGEGGNLGRSRRIVDRESEYSRRRFFRTTERVGDAEAEATPTPSSTAMNAQEDKQKQPAVTQQQQQQQQGRVSRKRSRWDDAGDTPAAAPAPSAPAPAPAATTTGRKSRWDRPKGIATSAPSTTSTAAATTLSAAAAAAATTTTAVTASTAFVPAGTAPAKPSLMSMPGTMPLNADGVPMTPEQYNQLRHSREMEQRNRPLTDEELDKLLPGDKEGFAILPPPEGYEPLRDPNRKASAEAAGTAMTGFAIAEETRGQMFDLPPELAADLPELKPEDYQHFAPILQTLDAEDEARLTSEEVKTRKILRLLLKVKNGIPIQRKGALRQITDKAVEFGADALFSNILPLLMSPTLEDQERHLLVKVIDRVLYKLDELVRPHVHKILVVIEPLLIDEDYYARVEGREIIANLSKAAGLATMISAMRPDIDNVDEYVRNTTARAFAVVASALGIAVLVPFLKAVSQSKKSWQARHTGIKVVQQIAILMGCAILPHLRSLVEVVEHGLTDESQKVRTMTALAIAALAESSAPYGIESFDPVLKPLWTGIRSHRGKVLAAFLKAIGFIVPLMDGKYADFYTREVMVVLVREFASPDEEMRKIVLRVVKQCVTTDGVEASYIKEQIIPEFFKNFWTRRMALERRNYKLVVETTVAIGEQVGCGEIVSRIVEDLKDESEPYRKMVMETLDQVISKLGTGDIDTRTEEILMDGILYAFQEQTTGTMNEEGFGANGTDAGYHVMLNGFGTVCKALHLRAKPYIPQICGTIKWRLNHKSARTRQQAADLIAQIAPVLKDCGEEGLMGHLGVVLYEYLGEEYPEVLASILGALTAIVSNIGISKMTPPIKDLLPRLTPILRNRQEKVQETLIDLIGRIADRGSEHIPAKEWMRICFEMLDMLKAHKKTIRRATVNTFGYIARAVGPQDVLVTLLNNLKVQERQNRVCTTVAIAIVAETCGPFTVLPALLNEYRVQDMNVQNGVLKTLSFLFEYIGEQGRDYINSVTNLLVDALIDRDEVHRQTAMSCVSHMSLGVANLGCEEQILHLFNHLWPNIFEESPHVLTACMNAVNGCRVALGPGVILMYTLQGLFHPARRVRDTIWRVYNNLYIGGSDALVAFYPRLDFGGDTIQFGDDKDEDMEEDANVDLTPLCYRRHELEMVI